MPYRIDPELGWCSATRKPSDRRLRFRFTVRHAPVRGVHAAIRRRAPGVEITVISSRPRASSSGARSGRVRTWKRRGLVQRAPHHDEKGTDSAGALRRQGTVAPRRGGWLRGLERTSGWATFPPLALPGGGGGRAAVGMPFLMAGSIANGLTGADRQRGDRALGLWPRTLLLQMPCREHSPAFSPSASPSRVASRPRYTNKARTGWASVTKSSSVSCGGIGVPGGPSGAGEAAGTVRVSEARASCHERATLGAAARGRGAELTWPVGPTDVVVTKPGRHRVRFAMHAGRRCLPERGDFPGSRGGRDGRRLPPTRSNPALAEPGAHCCAPLRPSRRPPPDLSGAEARDGLRRTTRRAVPKRYRAPDNGVGCPGRGSSWPKRRGGEDGDTSLAAPQVLHHTLTFSRT